MTQGLPRTTQLGLAPSSIGQDEEQNICTVHGDQGQQSMKFLQLSDSCCNMHQQSELGNKIVCLH